MNEPATDLQIIAELMTTLQARRSADPGQSYVASLYAKGIDTILKKIGEEAAETIIAAKGEDRAALVHEIADLWFHTLVLMAAYDVPLGSLTAELARRSGRSGLDEKAGRTPG